jgi:hypothetical protein
MRQIAIITGILLISASVARADRRAFVHTYEYMTAPKGATELELWNTQSRSEFGNRGASGFDLQLELEHGITDRWDIALYQVLAQVDAADPAQSESLHFASTRVETRYRFAERGELPVNVLVYFEVGKQFGETRWEIEPKLVLSRDFGKTSVSLNIIPEIEVEKEVAMTGEGEVEPEFEPGWALGVSHELMPQLKLGAETFGAVKSPGGNNDVMAWAGPSVSWAPSPDVWVAANAGFGLTQDAEEFLARFIVGVGL